MEVADESSRKDLEYQYIAPTADYANELNRAVEQLQVPDEALDRGIDEMMAVGSLQQCLDTFEKFVKGSNLFLLYCNVLVTFVATPIKSLIKMGVRKRNIKLSF